MEYNVTGIKIPLGLDFRGNGIVVRARFVPPSDRVMANNTMANNTIEIPQKGLWQIIQ